MIRYLPVNARLKTYSSRYSRMYKVYYSAANGTVSGYVYRANLWSRLTTVYKYIKKPANLYTGTSSSKRRKLTISINSTISTTSNLNSSMYYVHYYGSTGYVYAGNLSTGKTAVTKYVRSSSKQYKNYGHTSYYGGYIPVDTKLTTTSPQSNRLYWVNYNHHGCYVYASNLSNSPTVITKYTKNFSRLYRQYGQTGGFSAAIPTGVKITTTSPQYDRLFQVSYDNKSGYVYASNLTGSEVPLQIPTWQYKYVSNPNGFIYNQPTDDDNQRIKDGKGYFEQLNVFNGIRLYVDKTATLNGETWYEIRKPVGNYIGWAKSSDLTDAAQLGPNTASLFNNLTYATVTKSGYPIFNLSPGKPAEFVRYSDAYYGQTVLIRQSEAVEGYTMYYLDGIGWIDGNAVDVPGVRPISFKTVKNPDQGIFQSSDLQNRNGSLSLRDYQNNMLEVIQQDATKSKDLIKINYWYDQPERDIFLGWVNDSDLNNLQDVSGNFHQIFTADTSMNQQGLAYGDGYYYVGYDTGGNYGTILKYDSNGRYVGKSGTLPLGHACSLSYYNGKLYEAAVINNQTIINVINPNDLTSEGTITPVDTYGNPFGGTYMMAVKDSGDSNHDPEFILLQEGSNKDTFIYFDSQNAKQGQVSEKKEAAIPQMGVAQGMQYDNGKIYYLANNYLTEIDEATLLKPGNSGAIEHSYHFGLPQDSPSEAEGLTMNGDKLAIGVGHHQIFEQINPFN